MPARISSTASVGARYRSTSLVFRCRQGAGVEFVVGRQRQRVEHHHRGRHHIRREPIGQPGARLGRVDCPGHRLGDIADQAFVAGAVLAGDHHRLLDPVQPGQRGLDLAEFDAIPADLDLLIGAPQILQLPVGAPPHQIPGAIHPRPGPPERTRHKPRRGQPGPAPDIHTPARPGHIQLTDHPGRHRPQPPVQHEQRRPGHRRADRQPPDPAVSGALMAAHTVVSVGP